MTIFWPLASHIHIFSPVAGDFPINKTGHIEFLDTRTRSRYVHTQWTHMRKRATKNVYACLFIEYTPIEWRLAHTRNTSYRASSDREEQTQKFAASMPIAKPIYTTEMN